MMHALIAPGTHITRLTGGRKVVPNSGSRVRMATGETAVSEVLIQALFSNAGNIMVGGDDVDSSASSENGAELVPGEKLLLSVDDLSRIWLDADNDGEGVNFLLFHG